MGLILKGMKNEKHLRHTEKNITKSSLIKVKESTQFRNFYVCRILATSAKMINRRKLLVCECKKSLWADIVLNIKYIFDFTQAQCVLIGLDDS